MVLDSFPLDIAGKGDLPAVIPKDVKPMLTNAVMRAFSRRLAFLKDNVENKTSDPLKEFTNHLLEKGTKTIKYIATEIVSDLNITINITAMLEVATYDYTNTIENYYEFVKKSQNESDRDLLYLDMVETSCRLLYHVEKKLLTDIIMHVNYDARSDEYKNMTHKLLKQSKEDRKEIMQYVCDKYQVCRAYPAFTDYFADLVSEIVILDDKRFRVILESLTKTIKQNEKIFANFMEKKDRELIADKLRRIPNTYAFKDLFFVARSVLNQRYKTIISGSEEFKNTTRSTSIILDIIDKALTSEENVLAIDFDNSVQAIRGWSADKRHDIDKYLDEFVTSFLRRLNHNLTKNARQELKVLIKTIMRGGNTPDDEIQRRSLFKSGSKYVKGKDFHPDVDIMSE